MRAAATVKRLSRVTLERGEAGIVDVSDTFVKNLADWLFDSALAIFDSLAPNVQAELRRIQISQSQEAPRAKSQCGRRYLVLSEK